MREAKIKVLLVDDHPLTLSGIDAFLKGKRRIRIVGKAVDGIEAIQKAKQLIPDVVLMDINLPKRNGLEALRMLRKELPATRVLMLTMHDNKEYVRESMRLGASGYMLKSSSPKELECAIETICADKIYLSSKFASQRLKKGINNAKANYFVDARLTQKGNIDRVKTAELVRGSYHLTTREKEILFLIVEGNTMQQIAHRLALSYNTMTTHFKHIYHKLEVHNRGSVVAKAIKEGIV